MNKKTNDLEKENLLNKNKALTDIEKEDLLKKIIFKLSSNSFEENDKEYINIISNLKNIYCDDVDKNHPYRHMYSSLFIYLGDIHKSDNIEYSLDYLSYNLNCLNELIQNEESEILKKSFFKLYDHLVLEIRRLLYYPREISEIDSKMEEISDLKSEVSNLNNQIIELKDENKKQQESLKKESEKLKNANVELKKANADLNKASEKLENIQKEYIAILGIFASVVLTISGAFSFSTSVLENMNNSSIYRTVLVICLLGFVFINLLFALFKFIENTTNVKYYKNKFNDNKLNENKNKFNDNKLNKNKNKNILKIIIFNIRSKSIIFKVNLILFIIAFLSTVAWFTGACEQRDQRITNSFPYSQSAIIDEFK